MGLGARIEDRRIAVGIKSQAELARRVEMPQTTMNGLINKPYRWSPYLPRLARELSTSVEYLVGETDDPDEGAPAEPALSRNERELLACWALLDPAQQAALLTIAMAMAGRGSGRLHGPKTPPQPEGEP